MAEDKSKLDSRFEEVSLDSRFEEVPLDARFDEVATEADQPSSLSSDAKDLALGMAQGPTLGFTDEILAGAQAGGQKIKDVLTGQQGQAFLDNYRKLQKEYEGEFDAAQERSPFLYGAGEITGGIIPGLLTGGAGLAAGISKSGLRAAGIGAAKQGLKEGLSKEAVKELSEAAAKQAFKSQLVNAGKFGAAVGSIAGAGHSKGDLSSIEGAKELGLDALSGAAVGGVLTPAIAGGGYAAGQRLETLFKDRPEFRRYLASFQRGSEEGKGFLGNKAEKEILDAATQQSDELGGQLVGLRNQLSADVGDVLESGAGKMDISAPLLQTQLELEQLANQQRTLLTSREYDKLKALLHSGSAVTKQGNPVSPKEAFDLRQQLINFKKTSNEGGLNQIADNAISSIEGELNNIPGFKEALTKLRTIPEQTGELFLNKTIQETGKPAATLSEGINTSLTRAGKASGADSARNERSTIMDFFNNLRQIKEENPGMLQKAGINNIDELESKVQNLGDLKEVSQQITGKTEHGTSLESLVSGVLKTVGLGANTAGGVGLNLANRLGQAANFAKSNPVTRFSKNIALASEDELRNIGTALQGHEKFKELGNLLIRGLDNKDVGAKNAAMFIMMQKPEVRKLFNPNQEEDINK